MIFFPTPLLDISLFVFFSSINHFQDQKTKTSFICLKGKNDEDVLGGKIPQPADPKFLYSVLMINPQKEEIPRFPEVVNRDFMKKENVLSCQRSGAEARNSKTFSSF